MLRCRFRPDEPAHGVDAEQRPPRRTRAHECVLLRAHCRIVVQHVVEVRRCPRGARPSVRTAVSTRRARVASNGCRRSSVFATGSSIASGGTSASVGWSAADNWIVSAPRSRANSSQSSIALSGSRSRTARSVSSWKAAVRMPTGMNAGANGRIVTLGSTRHPPSHSPESLRPRGPRVRHPRMWRRTAALHSPASSRLR